VSRWWSKARTVPSPLDLVLSIHSLDPGLAEFHQVPEKGSSLLSSLVPWGRPHSPDTPVSSEEGRVPIFAPIAECPLGSRMSTTKIGALEWWSGYGGDSWQPWLWRLVMGDSGQWGADGVR
jgi:hypothetical protein